MNNCVHLGRSSAKWHLAGTQFGLANKQKRVFELGVWGGGGGERRGEGRFHFEK